MAQSEPVVNEFDGAEPIKPDSEVATAREVEVMENGEKTEVSLQPEVLGPVRTAEEVEADESGFVTAETFKPDVGDSVQVTVGEVPEDNSLVNGVDVDGPGKVIGPVQTEKLEVIEEPELETVSDFSTEEVNIEVAEITEEPVVTGKAEIEDPVKPLGPVRTAATLEVGETFETAQPLDQEDTQQETIEPQDVPDDMVTSVHIDQPHQIGPVQTGDSLEVDQSEFQTAETFESENPEPVTVAIEEVEDLITGRVDIVEPEMPIGPVQTAESATLEPFESAATFETEDLTPESLKPEEVEYPVTVDVREPPVQIGPVQTEVSLEVNQPELETAGTFEPEAPESASVIPEEVEYPVTANVKEPPVQIGPVQTGSSLEVERPELETPESFEPNLPEGETLVPEEVEDLITGKADVNEPPVQIGPVQTGSSLEVNQPELETAATFGPDTPESVSLVPEEVEYPVTAKVKEPPVHIGPVQTGKTVEVEEPELITIGTFEPDQPDAQTLIPEEVDDAITGRVDVNEPPVQIGPVQTGSELEVDQPEFQTAATLEPQVPDWQTAATGIVESLATGKANISEPVKPLGPVETASPQTLEPLETLATFNPTQPETHTARITEESDKLIPPIDGSIVGVKPDLVFKDIAAWHRDLEVRVQKLIDDVDVEKMGTSIFNVVRLYWLKGVTDKLKAMKTTLESGELTDTNLVYAASKLEGLEDELIKVQETDLVYMYSDQVKKWVVDYCHFQKTFKCLSKSI